MRHPATFVLLLLSARFGAAQLPPEGTSGVFGRVAVDNPLAACPTPHCGASPLAGAPVDVFRRADPRQPVVRAGTNDSGYFDIALAPGRYILVARKPRVCGDGESPGPGDNCWTSQRRLVTVPARAFTRVELFFDPPIVCPPPPPCPAPEPGCNYLPELDANRCVIGCGTLCCGSS